MKRILILACLLLFTLNIVNNPQRLKYQGFQSLEWQESIHCLINSKLPIQVLDKSNATYLKNNSDGTCTTKVIKFPASSIVELEYFRTDNYAGDLEILNDQLQIIKKLNLADTNKPAAENSGSLDWPMRWRTLRLDPAKNNFPELVSIRIVDSNPDSNSLIALRSRVNFYQKNLTAFPMLSYLILLVLFIYILSTMKKLINSLSHLNYYAFFFFSLLLTTLIHFRPNLFFYWDEWHTIEQFIDNGFLAAFKRHNEHRVPLLFLTYFTEIVLFADKYHLYLFISHIIHSLNAVLLCHFIKKIMNGRVYAKETAYLLSFFYLINALHSEALRWAIDQASIICMTFILISLNCFYSLLKENNTKNKVYFLISTAVAPLFFANGFTIIFHIALLYVFIIHFDLQIRPKMKRLIKLILYYCAAILVPCIVYGLLSQGEGFDYKHIESTGFKNQLEQIKDYLGVGSQFATILRGLGLFHTISQEGAYNIFGPGFVLERYRPEEICAAWGIAISFVILICCLLTKEPKRYLKFFFYGQLTILASLILPAIARSRFGSIQSLALRYQTQALLGLCIMMIPWVERLVSILKYEGKRVSIASVLLCLFVISHLQMAISYDYFSSRGLKNINYLAQLEEWQKIKESFPERQRILLEPLLPANLTPKRTPARINEIHLRIKNSGDT